MTPCLLTCLLFSSSSAADNRIELSRPGLHHMSYNVEALRIITLLVDEQADVWEFFRRSGLYGQEIATHGGKRGPACAYYLPSLSAMQLFLPAEAHDGIPAHRPHHQLYSHEADWGHGWSSCFRPLAELFETVWPSPC